MIKRPYRSGSILGPAPKQDFPPAKHETWLDRISAYWPRQDAKARDVGRALLTFLGADGQLFPSQQTIADRVGISVRSVNRWLKRMQAAGFLVRIRRRTLFGQTSTAYVLTDHCEQKESDYRTPESPVRPESSATFSLIRSLKDLKAYLLGKPPVAHGWTGEDADAKARANAERQIALFGLERQLE